MTGYAVRGHMGFVAKDGEPFDRRLNVRFQSWDIEEMERLRKPDESQADWIRAAVRERIQRCTTPAEEET